MVHGKRNVLALVTTSPITFLSSQRFSWNEEFDGPLSLLWWSAGKKGFLCRREWGFYLIKHLPAKWTISCFVSSISTYSHSHTFVAIMCIRPNFDMILCLLSSKFYNSFTSHFYVHIFLLKIKIATQNYGAINSCLRSKRLLMTEKLFLLSKKYLFERVFINL